MKTNETARSFACAALSVLATTLNALGIVNGPIPAAADGGPCFGAAEWICPAPLLRATNTTAEFRATFTATESGAATLAIAADTVCSISLNGRTVVETLRFPDVPPERLYDLLDVPDVHKGENELLIRLYVQGINSFQHIPGNPGLLFSLTAPGCRVTSGATTEWRISTRDRAEGVHRVTDQLGYSFEFHAAAKPDDWRPVGRNGCIGRASEMSLRRRPVPRAEVRPLVPSRLVVGSATNAAPASGELRLLVDLGREESGLLLLDCETDAGAMIDIGWAEHAEDGRIRTRIGNRNFSGRYVAREGHQSFTYWQRRVACRFIELRVHGAKSRFVLNALSLKPVVLPVRRRPVPANLSPERRKIWETAVRTLELCMHEHYEDCPWREQALYANDARNQILAGRYAFEGNEAFAALSLELLAKGLRPDGWLSMCMPARIPFTIPSFTFSWTLAMKEHWDFTHDEAFARRMFPVMRTVLDTRLSEMKGGLLPCPVGNGYWQFYDWAKGLSGGDGPAKGSMRFESPLNMFFLLSLESDAALADAIGETAAAERWRGAAAKLRPAIRTAFWNAGKKQFEMAVVDGRMTDEPASELVQSLAILANVVPDGEAGRLAEKLSRPSDWTETTLSQSVHKFAALLKIGGECARRAMESMDGEWMAMLDAGATSFWEMREGWKAFDNAGSLCHGWSAIPVYFYGAYLSSETGDPSCKGK